MPYIHLISGVHSHGTVLWYVPRNTIQTQSVHLVDRPIINISIPICSLPTSAYVYIAPYPSSTICRGSIARPHPACCTYVLGTTGNWVSMPDYDYDYVTSSSHLRCICTAVQIYGADESATRWPTGSTVGPTIIVELCCGHAYLNYH